MCGIFGTTKTYTRELLDSKLNRIHFRGPDYTSIKKYENVTFGHNRLAIIDLDERSNQPFVYEYISIVFNGEIYNFNEIKKELEKKGYKFHTMSDTEVICAAYIEYGATCVEYFNGMFAFVLYDKKQQYLFGARDRLGQKPFYYSLKGGHFEFASQISQIKIGNDLTINEKAISQFLLWKYIPEPNSIYNEVKKLKAGYSFIYNLETKFYREKQYWDIPDNYNTYKGTYSDACNDLEELLRDAVDKRMMADVPLGVFLSGGIDSSLIATLAQQQSSIPIKTFSIKFNEKGFDESVYAEKVANVLKTDHLTIPCDYKEGIDLIENHNYYYDEPFSDSSAIPSMLLAKHTRKDVTVALTGDAGDESFLGYTRYDWIRKISSAYKFPFFFRNIGGAFLKLIPINKVQITGEVLKMKSEEEMYIRMVSSLNNKFLKDPSIGASLTYNSWLGGNKPLLEKISDYDLKTFLNGDINTKVDRATMAFSLEARAPFLDYRIVELGRMLPTEYKYSKSNKKKILKDILYKYLSKDLFNRPKAGFTMPFETWFRNELKDLVLDSLTKSNLKNIPNLNVDYTLFKIKKHMEGKVNFYPTIWSLLVLNRFYKNE